MSRSLCRSSPFESRYYNSQVLYVQVLVVIKSRCVQILVLVKSYCDMILEEVKSCCVQILAVVVS